MTAAQARQLLPSIQTHDLFGLRERAIVGTEIYARRHRLVSRNLVERIFV